MIEVTARQDGQRQVILQALEGTYQLRKTRNPTGWAILIEDTKPDLICPGCGDYIPHGQSKDCSCYKED